MISCGHVTKFGSMGSERGENISCVGNFLSDEPLALDVLYFFPIGWNVNMVLERCPNHVPKDTTLGLDMEIKGNLILGNPWRWSWTGHLWKHKIYTYFFFARKIYIYFYRKFSINSIFFIADF